MSAWTSLFTSPTAAFTVAQQELSRPLLSGGPPMRGGRGGGGNSGAYRARRGGPVGSGRGGRHEGNSHSHSSTFASSAPLIANGFSSRTANSAAQKRKSDMADNSHEPKRNRTTNDVDAETRALNALLSAPAESPEEIASWIAERKKKFPTAAKVEEKMAAHAAAVERGEIMPRGRGGRGGRGRGGRGGGRYGNNNNNNNASSSSHPPRPHYVLASDDRSDVEDASSADDSEAEDEKRSRSSIATATAAPSSSATPVLSAPAAASSSSSSSFTPSTTPSNPRGWKQRPCRFASTPSGCSRPVEKCSYLHPGETVAARPFQSAKVDRVKLVQEERAFSIEPNTSVTASAVPESATSTTCDALTHDATGQQNQEPTSSECKDKIESMKLEDTVAECAPLAVAASESIPAPVAAAIPTASADSTPSSSSSSLTDLTQASARCILQSIHFLVNKTNLLRQTIEQPMED